jgi:hypothetical protein
MSNKNKLTKTGEIKKHAYDVVSHRVKHEAISKQTDSEPRLAGAAP